METDKVWYCPVCKKSHDNPYGRIIMLVSVCSRKCSEAWEALTFDEKQKLVDLTD